jgi:hypothetical protein
MSGLLEVGGRDPESCPSKQLCDAKLLSVFRYAPLGPGQLLFRRRLCLRQQPPTCHGATDADRAQQGSAPCHQRTDRFHCATEAGVEI